MNEELKSKLLSLGLTEEQVAKLASEGAATDDDLKSLSGDDIKSLTGCGLITARKVAASFASVPVAAPAVAVPVDATAEIPEGAQPSTAQVNNFASSLGIDPSMLTMFMFAGASADAGMGMDISSMIPISQIVAGYSPKVRNMFYMVMGQLEARMNIPIVVINNDGSVNKALTVEYIEGLEEGRDPAENNVYYDSVGSPYEVIAVGVDAQSIYDADPFDSTRALQRNGMGIGNINWHGVSLEVRQVAYYAAKTGEVDPSNSSKMDLLRDKIKPDSRRLIFSGMAPKAIAMFNEANRSGSLPTLRVMLSRAPRRREVMPRRRSANPRDLSGIGRDVRDPRDL